MNFNAKSCHSLITALKQTHRKLAMPVIVTMTVIITMTVIMTMIVIVEATKIMMTTKIYLILRTKILSLLMIWKNL